MKSAFHCLCSTIENGFASEPDHLLELGTPCTSLRTWVHLQTGAMMVALGQGISGHFTDSEDLAKNLKIASGHAGRPLATIPKMCSCTVDQLSGWTHTEEPCWHGLALVAWLALVDRCAFDAEFLHAGEKTWRLPIEKSYASIMVHSYCHHVFECLLV